MSEVKRIRIKEQERPRRRVRRPAETLPLDPRDPDVVRAKGARWCGGAWPCPPERERAA